MKCGTLKVFVPGLFLVLVGLLPGIAQSTQSENAPPANSDMGASSKPHDETFIIGNDDVLSISVWKEPELTNKALPVRSDGKISLPLVGEMQAAGRTPLQLEESITEKLKGFITAPEVTVIVQEVKSRKYNVLGEVAKPGLVPTDCNDDNHGRDCNIGRFQGFREKDRGIRAAQGA